MDSATKTRVEAYLAAQGAAEKDWEVRRLGTDPDMVSLILAVIARGEKTMTFSLPPLAERDGRRPPVPGRRVVLLDADDRPRQLLRLTEVRPLAFGDVSAGDLAREGMPMRDPEAWRALHREVWAPQLAALGLAVENHMTVWAEYFDLLHAD